MTTSQTDYRARTVQAYDALAGELAQGFDDFFERFAHVEAAHFLASLEPNGLILDLGCGGGVASSYFVEQGYKTISADLSAEMLRECRMRGLKDLVRLDLEALAFGHRSFDGIWAHTCLLHVPKVRLRSVLNALEERIKSGGRLFVALREGKGEGYVGQTGLERWFSSFTGAEFEAYIAGRFHVLRRARTELKSTTFLSYHLARGDAL